MSAIRAAVDSSVPIPHSSQEEGAKILFWRVWASHISLLSPRGKLKNFGVFFLGGTLNWAAQKEMQFQDLKEAEGSHVELWVMKHRVEWQGPTPPPLPGGILEVVGPVSDGWMKWLRRRWGHKQGRPLRSRSVKIPGSPTEVEEGVGPLSLIRPWVLDPRISVVTTTDWKSQPILKFAEFLCAFIRPGWEGVWITNTVGQQILFDLEKLSKVTLDGGANF